jgi:hypothetical protein
MFSSPEMLGNRRGKPDNIRKGAARKNGYAIENPGYGVSENNSVKRNTFIFINSL